MLRIIVNLLVLLMTFSSGMAIDHVSLMRNANTFYSDGDYKAAIVEYEKVLAAGGNSTVLHYNLGCAYFNEQIYGQAVYHFEKAKLLSPRDEDVIHNLQYAQLFLKDRFELPEPMPLVKWITDIRQYLSLNELKLLEMSCFALTVILLVLMRSLRNTPQGRIFFYLSMVGILSLLLSSGWLIDRYLGQRTQTAVLLTDESAVTSAPIPGSSKLFVIHEGTQGEILDATDSWYKIRLPDGKTGWIPNEVVGVY